MRKSLISLLCYWVSGSLAAAETLAPLQVDPALLDSSADAAQEAPQKGEAAPAAPVPAAQPAPADAAPAPAAPQTPPAAPQPVPAPAARPVAPRVSAPAARPAAPVAAAAPRPAVQTMPLLQVDPALLGMPTAPAGAVAAEAPAGAPAAAAEGEVPQQPSATLAEDLAAARANPEAVFVTADKMEGRTDDVSEFDGNVELHRKGAVLTSDHLSYDHVEQEAHATGDVVLQQDGDTLSGPEMRLRMDTREGFMAPAAYSFERETRPGQPRGANSGHGTAERLEFQGENQYYLKNATFSTCTPDNYDWYAQATDLQLDYDREVGEARNARVLFKDVPIMYLPRFDFPLSDRRKSGFLPLTFGSSDRTGVDVYVPWYWNIAPHMDATLAPRIMSRRGVQLNGEFRYLQESYTGTANVEWLPKDNVTGEQRSLYRLVHTQRLAPGMVGQLNLNGASDRNYFSDLGTRLANTSQSYLLRQGVVNYQPYSWLGTQLLLQKYQPLQNLTEPYARLPSFSVTAIQPDALGGLQLDMSGSFTAFDHPTRVEANRLVLYPQVSLPLQAPAAFLTPKLGMHYTSYQLSRQAAGVPDSLTRSLPILSVDSGLVMERDVEIAGNAWLQTLEPRLYYVYVPHRDQDDIPLFDTGLADFNFAQIFSENAFVGSDRISDANQLTAALTSRLINPQTGAEVVRAAFGTRFYFRDQTVTLRPTDTPRTRTLSDYLAALSGEVLPRTYVDTAVQYDSDTNTLERFKFGVRYAPEHLKLVNVAYRLQRDRLKEIDVSGQWPITPRWFGVGRYNYSLRDRRVVEALGGLEYDGGCWALRFVVQRLATGTTVSGSSVAEQTFNTSYFVQLELNGLGRLGSNPLDLLRRSVPGYGMINQPADNPVFGSEY